MSDRNNAGDINWNERARFWRQAAPAGLSTNDEPNQLLIDRAGIGPGDRVLDLACGAGEPAISIAVAVGDGGHVVALDASEGMLEGLRKRADSLDLGQIETHLGTLDDLPFEDGSFDAVTCRFGLMFAKDPAATVAAIRRVLKPGKRAAIMVHGPPDLNGLYTTVQGAVLDHFGEQDDGRATRRFKFSGEGELRALFQGAGFQDVTEEFISKPDIRQADEPFWDTLLMRVFGTQVSGMEDGERAALDQRIAAAFAPYRKGARIELNSSERMASGAA